MLNISLQSHERRHGRPQRNSSYGERGDWTRSHHHFGSNRQAGRKLIGWQLHGDGQVARTCGNRQVNADERAEEVHHVDATTLAYHVAIVCGQSNHKVFRSHEHGGGVALGGFEQRHTLTEHHGFLTIRDAWESVGQANEGGHVFAARTAVQCLRVGDLFDTSVVHHADAVGNGERFFLIVGHEHGGGAGFELDAADFVAQLHTNFGVKCGKRLVEQEHSGFTASARASATRCC